MTNLKKTFACRFAFNFIVFMSACNFKSNNETITKQNNLIEEEYKKDVLKKDSLEQLILESKSLNDTLFMDFVAGMTASEFRQKVRCSL